MNLTCGNRNAGGGVDGDRNMTETWCRWRSCTTFRSARRCRTYSSWTSTSALYASVLFQPFSESEFRVLCARYLSASLVPLNRNRKVGHPERPAQGDVHLRAQREPVKPVLHARTARDFNGGGGAASREYDHRYQSLRSVKGAAMGLNDDGDARARAQAQRESLQAAKGVAVEYDHRYQASMRSVNLTLRYTLHSFSKKFRLNLMPASGSCSTATASGSQILATHCGAWIQLWYNVTTVRVLSK